MAYVKVSSGLLAYKSVAEIEQELQTILQALGDVERPVVSRVDLFVDFCSEVDMESWNRRSWVTKASAVHQYAEDKTFTGWTVGAGGVVMARLYNKLIEIAKSGKVYLPGLWHEAGWDGTRPVWRLEFEFKRELLAQMNLNSVGAVLNGRAGLWSYATTEWLRLAIPSGSDATRSRWPIHPLWAELASIDWGMPGGPMLRTYKPVRAPSMEFLGSRAIATFASVAAVQGTLDFNQAAAMTADAAWKVLGLMDTKKYMGAEQIFMEKVQALVRRYNLRMNDTSEEPDPDDPILQNPYYRAKQGLREQ